LKKNYLQSLFASAKDAIKLTELFYWENLNRKKDDLLHHKFSIEALLRKSSFVSRHSKKVLELDDRNQFVLKHHLKPNKSQDFNFHTMLLIKSRCDSWRLLFLTTSPPTLLKRQVTRSNPPFTKEGLNCSYGGAIFKRSLGPRRAITIRTHLKIT
jgi:hypothetical protein